MRLGLTGGITRFFLFPCLFVFLNEVRFITSGLVIDELIGQQEIVIKSLGKYIKQCKFISGATILGDGEVALILDANALL